MIQTNPSEAWRLLQQQPLISQHHRPAEVGRNLKRPPKGPQKPHPCLWQWFTLSILPVHLGNDLGLLQINSKIFWQGYFFKKITLRRHFRLNFKIKTFLRGSKSEAGMDVSGRLRVREVEEVQSGFAAMIWDSLAAVGFSQCPVSTPRALQVSQTFTHCKGKGENPVKAL